MQLLILHHQLFFLVLDAVGHIQKSLIQASNLILLMQSAEQNGLTRRKRMGSLLQPDNRINQNFQHTPDHQREKKKQKGTDAKSGIGIEVSLPDGVVCHVTQLLIRVVLEGLGIGEKIIQRLRGAALRKSADSLIIIALNQLNRLWQSLTLVVRIKSGQSVPVFRLFRRQIQPGILTQYDVQILQRGIQQIQLAAALQGNITSGPEKHLIQRSGQPVYGIRFGLQDFTLRLQPALLRINVEKENGHSHDQEQK
ncbi:hypothetical protein D3C75_659590 [compost metagenome]